MTPMLDITGDVCPMTFVKVKMGLAKIAPSETLNVLLKEEALKNVISSLKAEGHKVIKVVGRVDVFLLVVEKCGIGKDGAVQ
jgi:tRNA 2-thiouridine synthesizing protein A